MHCASGSPHHVHHRRRWLVHCSLGETPVACISSTMQERRPPVVLLWPWCVRPPTPLEGGATLIPCLQTGLLMAKTQRRRHGLPSAPTVRVLPPTKRSPMRATSPTVARPDQQNSCTFCDLLCDQLLVGGNFGFSPRPSSVLPPPCTASRDFNLITLSDFLPLSCLVSWKNVAMVPVFPPWRAAERLATWILTLPEQPRDCAPCSNPCGNPTSLMNIRTTLRRRCQSVCHTRVKRGTLTFYFSPNPRGGDHPSPPQTTDSLHPNNDDARAIAQERIAHHLILQACSARRLKRGLVPAACSCQLPEEGSCLLQPPPGDLTRQHDQPTPCSTTDEFGIGPLASSNSNECRPVVVPRPHRG